MLYCQTLHGEWNRRKAVNKRFSQRAFAKSLELDAGYFSRLMRQEVVPSPERARQIAKKIGLAGGQLEDFLSSVAEARRQRTLASTSKPEPRPVQPPTKVSEEVYAVISDMRHYAVLQVLRTDDHPGTAEAIAASLGMTKLETEVTLSRLLRCGLVARSGAVFRRTEQKITTDDKGKTSAALRASQKQILAGASRSLEADAIDQRSMTGMTMAINPAQVHIAKTMIQDFMEKLADFLEAGSKTEVYQLGVSLYPLARHIAKL